jgi:DNA-binding CsgD family transcriptional regulator
VGQPALALLEYEKYKMISDSLFTVDKATRMEELQLLYDVEKKDQQIVLLNKDITLRKLRGQLLTLGIVAVILLGGLIILMQISRRRKEKKLAAERYRRQQVELEKQQLEKQQLERELAAQVLQLCRKNELLANVQQEVEDISRPGGAATQSLNRLNRTIERSLNSDEDWAQFLSTFEKVHPHFLNHLQNQVGKLSPAEQRLACLLRMNLSSKEIATLLNISAQGVKKARYRLRKKLNLDSDLNLQTYLLNLNWREASN